MTRLPQESRAVVARAIAPDVYCLGPKGRTQTDVYFVRSGSSWALIDAGWAKDGPSIKQAAESVFGADTPPASILLTHFHTDHAGSALQLARIWDCPVYLTRTSCRSPRATSQRSRSTPARSTTGSSCP